MLRAYPSDAPATETPDDEALRKSHWIDLLSPSEAEIRAVEHAVKLHVPTRDEVSEIEASSRLKLNGDALYMSAPLIASDNGSWSSSPTGFVLSAEVCVTVRFAEMPAFKQVENDLGNMHEIAPAEAFTRILEEIVDRAADHLEVTADQLTAASRRIFDQQSSNDVRISPHWNSSRRICSTAFSCSRTRRARSSASSKTTW